MVDELSDERRRDVPFVADERSMLESWLEWHRITLLLKCEGLADDDRKRRPVATSKLSLHGLVRHMADVERNWFRRVLLDEQDVDPVFWRPGGDEDSELVPLDDAVWTDDLAAWEAECEASRATAARFDLEHCGVRRGEPCSLRWIYNHMIEEYARHNGHADLLRELIDGAVGD
jgi:uncharacterized damage-inducible protein DinB